jgi:hypothetical protein
MRFMAIAATLFAVIAATVGLSLIVLARLPWAPAASLSPCYLANNYILDVKSWTAEAKPNAELKIMVTVGLNGLWDFDILKNEKVAKLSGFVFLGIRGFSIGNPRELIGSGETYVYSQIIPGYDDSFLITRPKGSIRAFVCLTSWTLTNGQQWIANRAGERL